jgi:hypothetical protein
MIASNDRRREPRLRYSWEGRIYCDGVRGGHLVRMVDINSEGAAVLVENDNSFPVGKNIRMGMSYPRISEGEFDILNHETSGCVYRDQHYNPQMRKLVIKFHAPLSRHPAVGNEYILQ